jgi:hypothetical protein
MNNLYGPKVGPLISISLRMGLSVFFTQVTDLKGRQVVLFNVLDIPISTFFASFFAKRSYIEGNENKTYTPKVFLACRICGFGVAATITTLLMGSVNWGLLLLISAIAQTAGLIAAIKVNPPMPEEVQNLDV